jgi:WD40 repeat protein
MAKSVFISYAWEDDKPFVRRLHKDLTRSGFEVWWDRTSLTWDQRPFRQEIAGAICSHDRLILVVGPKAAASPSVRQEWQWALALDKPVIPILRKGDYTLVPGQLSVFQCDDFRDDTQYDIQFARLIESLRRPEPPLGALFGVPNLPPYFLPRPHLLHQVKDTLLADLNAPVVIIGADARVGLYGMGGIGKSVLAAALAHDRGVRRSFPDGIIWLTIGQQPNLLRLQHDVARHLGNKEHFDTESQGRDVLQQLLAQKAVLLILDDVWQTSDAQAFDVLGPRCRALVTTRDAGILRTLGGPSVPVALLTEPEARQLLGEVIGVEPSTLLAQAPDFVKECGYLPLAVALCGGMVKKHGGDGAAVLNRLRNADIEKITDPNALDERHRSIWRAMQVSVDALSGEEQQRLAELAVFARDNPIPEAAIATLWSHTGNLSDLDTTDLITNLADRSLIRLHQEPATVGAPIKRCVSLHDLLHDFATKLVRRPKALQRKLLDAYSKQCPAGWHDGPDDGYFYQHLAYHLRESGRNEELKKLLFDYQWLRKKLEVTDANGLMADYDFAADDSEARLVQRAIQLSSHTLAEDRSHLPSQLSGRLLSEKGSRVKAMLDKVGASEHSPWLRPLGAALTPPSSPLLRTLWGHEGPVKAVVVTPDGSQVISASQDKTVKVWELASGRTVYTLQGHNDDVNVITVTLNGRYAISGSRDKTLKVWDLSCGRVLHTLAGHKGAVTAVAATADGRYVISGSEDKKLRVWELASGRAVRALRCHGGWVGAVAMTPDGRHALSAGWFDNTLKVWDLSRGRLARTLPGHEGGVSAMAVTPDGRYVISAGRFDESLTVWELVTGRMVRRLQGHEGGMEAIMVTPDGRHVMSYSNPGTLRVWEVASGRTLYMLRRRGLPLGVPAVTPDGQTAIIGRGRLEVWDLTCDHAICSPAGHEFHVTALAVTPDGRHAVSGSWDKTVKVWDLTNGRAIHTLVGHESGVVAVAVTPDGRHVLSYGGALRVWELASGRAVHALAGPERGVDTWAVTPDGSHMVSVGSFDETLRVWNLASGQMVRILAGHEAWVTAVAITPDGRYVVSSSFDQTLKVWGLASGEVVHTLRGHKGVVNAVAITPDGRYVVSASDDHTLKVWDVTSATTVRTMRHDEGSASLVEVTSDGRHVVDVAYNRLTVWDLASGKVMASFRGDERIYCCAVAPDGGTIVVGEEFGRVYFLRLENITQQRRRSRE